MLPRRLSSLVSLLCALLATGSLAQPVESADPTGDFDRVPDALLTDDSEWYGLYIQDTKVGYLHRERQLIEAKGHSPVIELRDEFLLQTVVLGGERSMRITDSLRFEATPPYALVAAESDTEQGEDRRIVRLLREEGGFEAEVCEASNCRSHAAEVGNYTLGEAMAPEIWVLSQPEIGDSVTADSLLIGELRRSRDVLTLEGYETTILDGLPVRYARVRFEEAQTGLAGDLLVAEDGRWLAGTLSGTFEVRLESEESARQIDDTTDLFLAQAVAVNQPLGDPRELERVVLEHDEDVQLPTTDRQHWSCGDTGSCLLTLGYGPAPLQPADDDEVDEALASTIHFPADLPEIQEMAERVTAGVDAPRRQVRLLVDHVAEFVDDSYSAEPLSVQDLLDDPRGDCTEHAALFITLARSLGIPAREVHGLLYVPEAVTGPGEGAFGGHAWAEVLIDGEWMEVDPTWNQIPPDVGHIRLGHRLGDSAERQAGLAGSTLRVVKVE